MGAETRKARLLPFFDFFSRSHPENSNLEAATTRNPIRPLVKFEFSKVFGRLQRDLTFAGEMRKNLRIAFAALSAFPRPRIFGVDFFSAAGDNSPGRVLFCETNATIAASPSVFERGGGECFAFKVYWPRLTFLVSGEIINLLLGRLQPFKKTCDGRVSGGWDAYGVRCSTRFLRGFYFLRCVVVHYLYVTTCLVNGKRYVGQRRLLAKFEPDPNQDPYLGSGTLLEKAIAKYGKKSFSKEIVSWHANQAEVDAAEISFIKRNLVLENRNDWYNRDPGGQYNRSPEHKEIMSDRMTRIYNDPDYRKKRGWLSLEDREKTVEIGGTLQGWRRKLARQLRRRKEQLEVAWLETEEGREFMRAYHSFNSRLGAASAKEKAPQTAPHRRAKMSAKKSGVAPHDWNKSIRIAASRSHLKGPNTWLAELLLDSGVLPGSFGERLSKYTNGRYKKKAAVLAACTRLSELCADHNVTIDPDDAAGRYFDCYPS